MSFGRYKSVRVRRETYNVLVLIQKILKEARGVNATFNDIVRYSLELLRYLVERKVKADNLLSSLMSVDPHLTSMLMLYIWGVRRE